VSSDRFSTIICDTCNKQLKETSEVQRTFRRNQERLYKFLQENDDCANPDEFLKDTKEPLEGLSSLKDVKTDAVFVKIEPFDFHDYDTYFDQDSNFGGESSASDFEPPIKLIPKNKCTICDGIFNSEFQLKKHVGFPGCTLFIIVLIVFVFRSDERAQQGIEISQEKGESNRISLRKLR
jgi:hypothetical protein